jgi:hypothetical protein
MATEQRRVIWRHPKGIYETVEVSGTGVFGVPYTGKLYTPKTATHAAWPTRKSSLHRRTVADRPAVRAYR